MNLGKKALPGGEFSACVQRGKALLGCVSRADEPVGLGFGYSEISDASTEEGGKLRPLLLNLIVISTHHLATGFPDSPLLGDTSLLTF